MMFYVQAQFYFCNIKEITKDGVGGLAGGGNLSIFILKLDSEPLRVAPFEIFSSYKGLKGFINNSALKA